MELIDGDDLRRRLPVVDAIDALEQAFRDGDPSATPMRSHVETDAGSFLVMPAASELGVGAKLVTVTEGNPAVALPLLHAVYALFHPITQAPLAVIDGAALTALRTSAVSGLATRYLARPEASKLVLFGAGVQAAAHLHAMRAVRPIDRVRVVSRGRSRAEDLVEQARAVGLEAQVGTPDDVAEADIVCTCTTSSEPLFDGARLGPGCHVNAVGAYQPTTREVDAVTVAQARVVVETREVAIAEAGDLLLAVAEGAIGWDHVVADLAEVVRGAEVRRGPEDRTLFESVGLAFEDLAVAAAAITR